MNKVMQEDIKGIIKRDIKWEKLIGKTILITGATGMLGGYMLRTLVDLNKIEQYDMKLYALVRNPDKVPAELRDDIELIVQSVTEAIRADVIFDYVIHAASPASPLIMKEDPVGTIAANSLGAFYTLELAKQSNAEGYLFISSREIYGQPYENQTMFQENTYGLVDPLDPRSCYPEGKKAAETMCACYRQQYGLNAKIARLAHTFGPGMSIDDGRVQADFIKNVVNHQDIVLKSEGTAVRTYTYVSDAVAALFYILLNSDDLVYNIASEESTVSIRDLAQALVDAFPQRGLKLVFDIPTPDKNTGCAPFTLGILSSDKIRQLGWSPQYTLQEGLMRTVAFFEEN
ncbi:NAD-dependent epimerase/dehydratase family protein [Hominibacterium faecale]|uniref:NAD-dependent epimerase/dehydratase family protein n=1 Tax=Hominibacterium faecale TaxID=2839743 RepID=UPI0022B2AA4D|nr:NAD-dependent epimerase/dehydratase family protein [Hominibacterium faecale]